jgi:alkyl hydroperoxide reductase subunit AhpF
MPLLKESDRQALREEFAKLSAPVNILFFTQALDCETCGITEQILDEIAPLGEKLALKKYNYAIDREAVQQYTVRRIPAIALTRTESYTNAQGEIETRERDYGVRFYGVPSGYEFMSLIGGILDVSRGESGLSPESKQMLAQVNEPLHLQIFTTPT